MTTSASRGVARIAAACFIAPALWIGGLMTEPASAEVVYPWCLHVGDRDGGHVNCGFVSFEQCLATRSGIGGLCIRNSLYAEPVAPPAPRRASRARHR